MTSLTQCFLRSYISLCGVFVCLCVHVWSYLFILCVQDVCVCVCVCMLVCRGKRSMPSAKWSSLISLHTSFWVSFIANLEFSDLAGGKSPATPLSLPSFPRLVLQRPLVFVWVLVLQPQSSSLSDRCFTQGAMLPAPKPSNTTASNVETLWDEQGLQAGACMLSCPPVLLPPHTPVPSQSALQRNRWFLNSEVPQDSEWTQSSSSRVWKHVAPKK